jgi:hypothetical protein
LDANPKHYAKQAANLPGRHRPGPQVFCLWQPLTKLSLLSKSWSGRDVSLDKVTADLSRVTRTNRRRHFAARLNAI